MQDFVVNDDRWSQSIGFDATYRNGIVVTVGVLVNRTQEALLLDDLVSELSDDGYLPFRTKSRDLSLPSEQIQDVVLGCRGDVGICVHQDDDVTLPYAEATHSAILLKELSVATNDTVAIVDGDRSQAELLYQAASGMGLHAPVIVNCVQSEFYYPHLLLADIVAGTIADRIRLDPAAAARVSSDGPVEVVNETTTNSRSGRWNRGYSAASRKEADVEQPSFEQRYADSLRERVSCWFQGQFGDQNSPSPETDAITPVVGRLEALGCEQAATWIDEQ